MSADILAFPPRSDRGRCWADLNREEREESLAHQLVEHTRSLCAGDDDLAASALGRAYCLSAVNPSREDAEES